MKETRSKNKGQKTVREILEDIMKSEVRDEKLREKSSSSDFASYRAIVFSEQTK